MEREERNKRIGPRIKRLERMLTRNFEANARTIGLDEVTVMHGWVICYLYGKLEIDVYQKDLEKQFGIGRSAVTNIIQLLEKQGYLRREAVAHDARLKKVVLTEEGIRHHERMICLGDKMNLELIEGITDEEIDVFFRVLDKLEANIGQSKEGRLQGKEETNASNNIERSEGI